MRNGRKNLYITAAFTPKNTKPSAMNHFFGKSTGGTTFGLLLYGICLDFGSDGRNEGNRPGMNDKGLVSFDRKVKKDAYYVYQSRWSKTPMLQIARSRCIQRKRAKTEIKVYSNTDAVTLFVNGKQISTKEQKKISSQASFAGRDAGYKKEKIK